MSIELCVLASGSSGNVSVVRTPAGVLLIDAGLGPRTTAQRLDGTGVSVRDVSAICLTHLDRDHFTLSWIKTIVQQRIRLFCAAERLDDLLDLAQAYGPAAGADASALAALRRCVECFDTEESFEAIAGLRVSPISLAHDREGSHAFLAEGFGRRLGYATDLGKVSTTLIERLTGVDLLAIESNYDPHLQRNSGRPAFLQSRIMGGKGHLSNHQALGAVRSIFDRAQTHGRRLPAHVVLLHRSRQCNCPKIVRRLFEEDPRIASRLTLAEQFQRTDWLRTADILTPTTGEQLVLRWE